MNGVRTFAVGTLGGEEGAPTERDSAEDWRARVWEGDGMRGGTWPGAGYYWSGWSREEWLWRADGRFSRELVETRDFTEVCLRVGGDLALKTAASMRTQ